MIRHSWLMVPFVLWSMVGGSFPTKAACITRTPDTGWPFSLEGSNPYLFL